MHNYITIKYERLFDVCLIILDLCKAYYYSFYTHSGILSVFTKLHTRL